MNWRNFEERKRKNINPQLITYILFNITPISCFHMWVTKIINTSTTSLCKLQSIQGEEEEFYKLEFCKPEFSFIKIGENG